MSKDHAEKTAALYRMVTPGHLCPYGLKSKDLLERQGFRVLDYHLKTREETEDFMERHGVDTTPQAFIGGERIGGYDDLRVHFGLASPQETRSDASYQPVIAIFSVALLLALALSWHQFGTLFTLRAAEWFIALSMTLLAIQKLQDVEGFSTMFLTYDLLARRWVTYSKIYPFAEGLAGILMTAGALTWIAAPVAFLIGAIGSASIINAVYIERRTLKCACAGGGSKVPLGFVSLTESCMMMAMGTWMPLKALLF